ncbi:MAG: hypothetical protein M0Q98_06045 [Pseudomonas sp.]|jgi:hypothetical protein|nr:hypothetical protein [Pseudomonas sp.]MDD2223703.1 hypothetical protein [Pseudomonas sp.]NLO55323.1 hypothetical protein [Gammaproteobacteria bacterium]
MQKAIVFLFVVSGWYANQYDWPEPVQALGNSVITHISLLATPPNPSKYPATSSVATTPVRCDAGAHCSHMQ